MKNNIWNIMRSTLCLIFVLAFASFSGFSPVNAQLGWSTRGKTVFAIAPREVTRPLKIAEKSIKEKDFQQATELLGDLLAESMLSEYLIPDPDQNGGAISLRQKAEQLLGQIPLDQRGTYEEKYGVKAKVMLQKAIEANDTDAIAMTSRLYFHTRAGLEATMLVGHTHLSQGRPVMAAVAFEKVASEPEGRKRFDPEATLLAAVSWSLNGATDRSNRLLRDMQENQGDAKVRFYGKTVALFDENAQLSKEGNATPLFKQNAPLQNWLKQIVASTPLESHAIVNQWLLFRGDSQRNAESGSGFPLVSPRWSIRTVADPLDEVGIKKFQQNLIQAKVSPMPKVHPLAIGKTLVIRTEDRMFGVDADSGKRIWSYPPANVFRSGEQKSKDALERPSNKLHQAKLRERLWLDALYGQISSDGNSIFLIPNPGVSTERNDWPPRRFQARVYDEPTDLRLYNELKSLDLKQQGALQWQVGGVSGLDEPKLAKSFFLGAPLPIGDRLYAICLQEQTVRLVVLDSETGRLQWARHLASTEESVTFRNERMRRLAGATPSEADGVLICPTGLNAIVAVDLATQSLSWGFQFKEPKRARRVEGLTDSLSKWDTIWRDATVTLSGGAVIYTPTDPETSKVFCLNLQTGETLWKDRRKGVSRGRKSMHVETVRDGNIIITSSDHLKAIDLKTGDETWKTQLNDHGLVSGRGYVSGNHCFVPTTSKKVIRVNTSTGNIDGVVMTEKVLGNLISFRGDVISHSADHLTAYPRDEPSRLMLAEETETPLDGHTRLAIKAQLHLLDGQYQQSVDAISQAYDLFPNSNYAKVLVQALTRLIDVDFAKAEQVSDRYQNLFEKQDLQRLLRGKVSGLIKLNRFEDAFEALLQIADIIDLKSPAAQSPGQRIDQENGVVLVASSYDKAQSLVKNQANAELTLQLPQWLRWKLNEVYYACDADTQEAYRNAVAKHLKSFQGDSLTLRHDRTRLFPIDSLEKGTRLGIAAELLAAGHYVRADSLLEDAQSPTEPAYGISPRAESLLQRMIESDSTGDSISTLEDTIVKLQAIQSPERAILDPDLYELSSSESKGGRILRTDEFDVDWDRDVTRVQQEKLSNYFISTPHICNVVSTDQPELNTLGFRYNDEFREFQMYDRLGRFVHKIYLDPDGVFEGTSQGTKGRIFLHKSLLLLCINNEMFAIDWEKFIRGKAALLWSADGVVCSSSGYSSGKMDAIYVLGEGMLKCLSPFTGEVLWQRNQVLSRATLIEGDQSLTIWDRVGRTYDKVDPMTGRLLSCGLMKKESGNASAIAKDLQLFVLRKIVEQEPADEDETEIIFDSQRETIETLTLNLFDYDQQKFLWTKPLTHPVSSTLVDQNKLLLLSSEGVFSMINLRSGKLEFETEIQELKKSATTAIVVDKFRGLYVVTVYSSAQRTDYVTQDNTRVTFQRIHKGNAMINGHVVALDAATGESVWKYPIVVQSFQQLEGLPWDSPFLFLTRKNLYQSDKASVRIQVATVDIQSGKLKANELYSVPVRDNVFYRVVCQPQSNDDSQQSVELQVASLKAKYYLGNVATPPQPVAALTNGDSFKRMKDVVSASPVVPMRATDFQNLTDQAIAAEKQRVELGKEEVRLTELEMQKQ